MPAAYELLVGASIVGFYCRGAMRGLVCCPPWRGDFEQVGQGPSCFATYANGTPAVSIRHAQLSRRSLSIRCPSLARSHTRANCPQGVPPDSSFALRAFET